ncbi:MAG TPA: HoxN/HupN/NixA family nickel/cobalt transporter [Pseudolabrys sp.]|nr:HoxN/HupN/NixA family nickel/cobalt transporter [Pseudolabrys sp.]
MLSFIFDDTAERTRAKAIGLYGLLLAGNVSAWGWALAEFGDKPVLLGLAVLAYSFGLRHAFDADHIAAIDNVTRKLMQEGRRPIAAGFFFSLGHSTIVVALALAIAFSTTALEGRFGVLKEIGGVVGTSVSSAFLFMIAAGNVVVLVHVYRMFQAVKNGARLNDDHLDLLLAQRGLLGRVFRPAFRLIGRSWHMYPLGLLFGLGFDTATEVGLLGISAAQASQGLSIVSILVFPALFTAGMSLLDTTDSTMMVSAYGWAFVKPLRKLYYNVTVTLVSVVAALVIGSIEALGLLGGKLSLHGPFWRLVAMLSDNLGLLGYGIVGLFIASWIASFLIYKAKGYDRLEAST